MRSFFLPSALGLITLAGCATVPRAVTIPASQAVYSGPNAGLVSNRTTSRPPDVFPDAGMIRLPGGTLVNKGPVRAMVMSMSFGNQAPAFGDTTVAAWVIGSAIVGQERGPAGALALASDGMFHLDGSVFPQLIDTYSNPDSLLSRDPSGATLAPILKDVLTRWSRQVDMAAFDNDGPDGQPQSGDDDGALDLGIMVLETDSTSALVRVNLNMTVPARKGGVGTVKIPAVYVMAIPRTQARTLPANYPLGLIMGAMGVSAGEAFFPTTLPAPRAISTVARIQLGWASMRWVDRSSDYGVQDGEVLIVPVVDVDNHRGLYLVERDGRIAYVTRVARLADGHYATVSAALMVPADPDQSYPLSRSGGPNGPRLALSWPAGGVLSVNVVLTPRKESAPPNWSGTVVPARPLSDSSGH